MLRDYMLKRVCEMKITGYHQIKVQDARSPLSRYFCMILEVCGEHEEILVGIGVERR